ncbi:E3 ubiquitin-protein ligase TRIM21-like [Arapaima gigas]
MCSEGPGGVYSVGGDAAAREPGHFRNRDSPLLGSSAMKGDAAAWRGAAIALAVTLLLLLCGLTVALCLAWRKGYIMKSKIRRLFIANGNGKENHAYEMEEASECGSRENTDTDWKWRRRMAVKVTLDLATANPNLDIKGNEMSWTDERQRRPVDVLGVFDERPAVLGQVRAAMPGQYWEVCVGENRHWEVGVAAERAPRLGQLSISPRSGFWVVSRWEEELKALATQETVLNMAIPKTIGVYLDLLQHRVIFFNVEKHKLLYCFVEPVWEDVRPFFSTGDNQKTPLRVLPLDQGGQHSTLASSPQSAI